MTGPHSVEALREIVTAARWFPAKEIEFALTHIGTLPLTDPSGEAEVFVEFLSLHSAGAGTTTLQVPIVITPDGPAEGTKNAAFVRAFLTVLREQATVGSPQLGATGTVEQVEALAAISDADIAAAKPITGEQSNTSIIIPGERPAICKIFRTLSPGANPDVDVPAALASAGWRSVPRPLGWITGHWPTTSGVVSGHLSVISEYVPDAEDGFELMCRLARENDADTATHLARNLGVTTHEMHERLRLALPAGDAHVPYSEPAELAALLAKRGAWAMAAVPALSAFAGAIAKVHAQVAQLPRLPAPQRIHGDYHLGQVLRSSHRGWLVLDFEGEPLRPLSERIRPDFALRDVAGMYRSFDYAQAVGEGTKAWCQDVRNAFTEGYGESDNSLFARALELDKALYEAVYEAGNRPDWLHIPLSGVRRLLPEVL